MLRVTLAPGFRAEQEYIVALLLGEYLGVPFAIDGVGSSPRVSIQGGGKTLVLPQILFAGADAALTSKDRVAPPTCGRLNVEREGLPLSRFCAAELPIVYGAPDGKGAWILHDGDTTTLLADVLGSAFFCLARLEEITSDEKDAHGCFPATASLAWRESFLTRPVVNEYLELLFSVMGRLWPDLRRAARTFRLRVSHDVDRPWAYRDLGLRDRVWTVRNSLRKGALPPLAGSPILNGLFAAAGLPHRDPFDTFDWMMDREEAAGLRSSFYFLASQDTAYDARYAVDSSRIRSLIRKIHRRGHEVGLHASYSAFLSADRIRNERTRLARVMEEEGLDIAPAGGRQHYLRWHAPHTWRAWEEAGLAYDASVGFNHDPGFRAGICYEFPVFDAERRQALALRERPLMIMDIALLREEDGAPGVDAARRVLHEIASRVKLFEGTLELLWHNNHFCERIPYRELFEQSLRC